MNSSDNRDDAIGHFVIFSLGVVWLIIAVHGISSRNDYLVIIIIII